MGIGDFFSNLGPHVFGPDGEKMLGAAMEVLSTAEKSLVEAETLVAKGKETIMSAKKIVATLEQGRRDAQDGYSKIMEIINKNKAEK